MVYGSPDSSRTRSGQSYSRRSDLNASKSADAFPLIELPNPRAGEGGGEDGVPLQPATVNVYRPWTQADVSRAVEGIPHPKENNIEFGRQIELLYKSYKLNASEIERCLRAIIKIDWVQIQGPWDPLVDGVPMAFDDAALQDPLAALLGRITAHYQARKDWTKITECRQEDNETVISYLARLRVVFDAHSAVTIPEGVDDIGPYAQQLKNAFLNGLKPEITGFIKKHQIGWQTCTLTETKAYAVHAASVTQNKQKKKTINKHNSDTYFMDSINPSSDVFFRGNAGRGGFRGRGRGRRGGAAGSGAAGGQRRNDECHYCKRYGHWQGECRKRMRDEARGGEEGGRPQQDSA